MSSYEQQNLQNHLYALGPTSFEDQVRKILSGLGTVLGELDSRIVALENKVANVAEHEPIMATMSEQITTIGSELVKLKQQFGDCDWCGPGSLGAKDV